MGSLLNDEQTPTISSAGVAGSPIDTPILPPEDEIEIQQSQPLVTQTNESVKIPDRRGKKARATDALYASLGISQKYIPPITRKRSAVYQLIGMKGKEDMRLQGLDRFIEPPDWELVPSFTFHDSEDPDLTRREKTLTFFEGNEIVHIKDPISGKAIANSVQKSGTPRFTNGQVVVNIFKEFQRFVWWELHPKNASNKWRPQGVTPIFERVDTKWESPHVQLIKMNLKRDAEGYVLKLKPEEMINLAAALTNPTVPTHIGPQELRFALAIRARENPEEVLFKSPDKSASVKVAVIHSLDLGILTFVPEHESYYFGDEEEAMFRVPVTHDPFEALCEHLSGPDGIDDHKKMMHDLGFWF